MLYRRLGHAYSLLIKKVIFLSKPSLPMNKSLDFCDACQYGEGHLRVFPLTKSKASAPLELVHTNILGHAPTISKEGFHYYIHFIDVFSLYT